MPLALLGLLLPGYLSYPTVFNDLGAAAAKVLNYLCLAVWGCHAAGLFSRDVGASHSGVFPSVSSLHWSPFPATLSLNVAFFGVYHVRLVDKGQTRVLFNGSTIHGAESLLPGEERLPLTSYSPEGPFGPLLRGAQLQIGAARRCGRIGDRHPRLLCSTWAGLDVITKLIRW